MQEAMLVSKEEVDLAATHPKIIHAVDLAHLAWCEQLERQRPGWGVRYLTTSPEQLAGPGLRVRVAAVYAVVKDAQCEPDELLEVKPEPIVKPKEIARFLHHPLLLRFMTLANDAWDEEVAREYPDLDVEKVTFLEKYRKQAKPLFAASQIAVLKCIPTISVGMKLQRRQNVGVK